MCRSLPIFLSSVIQSTVAGCQSEWWMEIALKNIQGSFCETEYKWPWRHVLFIANISTSPSFKHNTVAIQYILNVLGTYYFSRHLHILAHFADFRYLQQRINVVRVTVQYILNVKLYVPGTNRLYKTWQIVNDVLVLFHGTIVTMMWFGWRVSTASQNSNCACWYCRLCSYVKNWPLDLVSTRLMLNPINDWRENMFQISETIWHSTLDLQRT